MNMITGVTRGGEEYTPAFVMEINQGNCIGCGRCFKALYILTVDQVKNVAWTHLEADDYDDDYDDYGDDDDGFSDDTAMVMSLKNALDCIGCGSCSRICPKKCFTHEPQNAAA